MDFNSLIQERRIAATSIFSGGTRAELSLWYAVNDIKSGLLLIPPHQRPKSWNKKRKIEYVSCIMQDNMPPGSFEIYQLIDDDGRKGGKWLNDGCQRILTAEELYDNPSLFGISKSDAAYILQNTSYPYTLKYHRTHKEALERFQIVNNNLRLTSYQIAIGDVVYCTGSDNYKLWQSFLFDLHTIVRENAIRVSTLAEPREKEKYYIPKLHKLMRHDVSLFFRYLTKDKSIKDYGASHSDLEIYSDSHFEIRLSKLLAEIGHTKAQHELEQFSRIIESDTASIEKVLIANNMVSTGISRTVYRWFLDAGIWRKNNNCPNAPWIEFIDFIIPIVKTKTNITYIVDGEAKQFTLSLGRIKEIHRMCDFYDLPFYDILMRKREYKDGKLKPGWEQSHIKPFSVFGEGETFPEPRSQNRARGAKIVDNDNLPPYLNQDNLE